MKPADEVMAQRERITKLAVETFDDERKAERWLHESNIRTANKPPIEVIGTPEGLDAVETVLYQIQYGVFA
jgi:uncharacterized protein (DUF2384 family)